MAWRDVTCAGLGGWELGVARTYSNGKNMFHLIICSSNEKMSPSSPTTSIYDSKDDKKYTYIPPRGSLLLLTLTMLALCFGLWSFLPSTHTFSPLSESTLRPEVDTMLKPSPLVHVPNDQPRNKQSHLVVPQPSSPATLSTSTTKDASTSSTPRSVKRRALSTLLSSTVNPSGVRTDAPTVDSFMLFAATLLQLSPALIQDQDQEAAIDLLILVASDFDPTEVKRVEVFVAQHPVMRIERVSPVTLPANTMENAGVSPALQSGVAQQLTKLKLWSLYTYSRILYVDVNCVFVQDPLVLFDLCGDLLCALPLPKAATGAGARVGYEHYSTSVLILTPSTELSMSLLDAVDASQEVHPRKEVAGLFPPTWSSLGTMPYLLTLQEDDSLVSSPEPFPLSSQTICVRGDGANGGDHLASLLRSYSHPNLPWNLPVHHQLISQLPSLADVLTRRRKKKKQVRGRHNRLRKRSRSSRLEY